MRGSPAARPASQESTGNLGHSTKVVRPLLRNWMFPNSFSFLFLRFEFGALTLPLLLRAKQSRALLGGAGSRCSRLLTPTQSAHDRQPEESPWRHAHARCVRRNRPPGNVRSTRLMMLYLPATNHATCCGGIGTLNSPPSRACVSEEGSMSGAE